MSAPETVFARIRVDHIRSGKNVRLKDDDAGLVESVRRHGILQPITVVPIKGSDDVECLFGHRRLAAAKAVGLDVIPCIARARGTADDRVLTQLAENRDRRDLSPLEEALAYKQLSDLGMTQMQIAAAVGAQQTGVSMRLILLTYPEVIQQAVHYRHIGLSDALAVPPELAQATNDERLRMLCRAGSRALRQWARKQVVAAEKAGQPMKRARITYESLNVDTTLMDDVRAAAKEADVKVVEYVRQALIAAMAMSLTTLNLIADAYERTREADDQATSA